MSLVCSDIGRSSASVALELSHNQLYRLIAAQTLGQMQSPPEAIFAESKVLIVLFHASPDVRSKSPTVCADRPIPEGADAAVDRPGIICRPRCIQCEDGCFQAPMATPGHGRDDAILSPQASP